MSKNKIAILFLIVSVTAVIGFFVGKAFLGGKQLKPVEVETARPIASEIVQPDKNIFNSDAINPTTTITIGQNNQTILGN